MDVRDVTVERSKVFADVAVFIPSVNHDDRGSIFTTYHKDIYDSYLPQELTFKHDKFAESRNNVLRGLHGDNKTWKLITCIRGRILEVVADMRPDSKTYLKWDSWVLDDENKKQILVPPNFVNGYYVISDDAVFHYKLAYEGEYIDAQDQLVVKWNDNRLGVKWPTENPILQGRDR